MEQRNGLAVEVCNPSPSGPRVLVVHGAMDRSSSFRPLARLLAPYEVLLYDRSGYARSTESGAKSFEGHLEDLARLLEERPALVFGHSLGGTYALALGATRPEGLLGIATFESPLPGPEWWDPAWGLDSTTAARGLAAPDEARRVAETFLVRMIGRATFDGLPAPTQELRRREGAAFVRELGELATGAVAIDLAAITAPSSHGISSRPSEPHARVLATLAQTLHGRYYCVLGTKHGAHLQRPEALAEVLRAQLAKL